MSGAVESPSGSQSGYRSGSSSGRPGTSPVGGRHERSNHERTAIGELGRLLLAGAPLVAAGIVAGAVTFTFVLHLPWFYQLLTPEGSERAAAQAALGASLLPKAFLGALVTLLAGLAGYFGTRRPALSGATLGTTAVFAEQTISTLGFPPFVPAEFAMYLLAGLPGGIIGGLAGGRLAERAATGVRIQARALLHMAHAAGGDAVARAVGTALRRVRPVEVMVWRLAPTSAGTLADGAWHVAGPLRPTADASALLRVVGDPLGTARTVTKRSLDLPEREEWAARGVGSIVVMPLLRAGREPGQRWTGLLVAAFSDGGRARRLALRPAARRRFEALAGGAAMALERIESQRAALESQREAVAARERADVDRRWAGLLHDTVNQHFYGIIRSLEGGEKADARGVPEAAAEARAEAQETAQEGLDEVRRLVNGKGPGASAGGPLPESITASAASVLRGTSISLEVEVAGERRSLPSRLEQDLTLVAREALHNVAKHSGGTRARVDLRYGPREVELEVSDNGAGMAGSGTAPVAEAGGADKPEGLNGGFGLRSMRDRVVAHSGTLRLEEPEGGGVRVVAVVPA